MFGQLRPKPDARMLRHVAGAAEGAAERAACWSRTRSSTRRRRARSACARCGCSATSAAASRRLARRRQRGSHAPREVGVHRCPKPRIRVCQNQLASASLRTLLMSPSSDPPAGARRRPCGRDPTATADVAGGPAAVAAPAAALPAPARKRPQARRAPRADPADAGDACSSSPAPSASPPPRWPPSSTSARPRCTATSPARRRCSRG